MPYPPTVPPTGRVNATPQVDNHPSDHNVISAALTDILNELGGDPSGGAANVQARLEAIEAKAANIEVNFLQTGQVYTAGQVAALNWDYRSDNTWGTGSQLTCPAGAGGVYGFTVAVAGPVIPPGAFADVLLYVKTLQFASFIPSGKSQVAGAAVDRLAPGDQVAVGVYNPVGSSQYFNGSLRIFRIA